MDDAPVRLQPPNDLEAVEVWLSRYDSSPRYLPRWPQSDSYVLVAVRINERDDTVEAWALPTRAAVAQYYKSILRAHGEVAHGYYLVIPRDVIASQL